jgi:tellurite resistance-related uncharacterized protein
LVRTNPEWNEDSLPAGLRRSHRLGSGAWGRIRVLYGRLQFSMASRPPLTTELVAGSEQAIPPEMDHEVQPLGRVRFALDMLKVDRSGPNEKRLAEAGGDPACWVGLLCPDCGAVLEEARHRPGCSEPEPA